MDRLPRSPPGAIPSRVMGTPLLAPEDCALERTDDGEIEKIAV